jgi:DNA processing protein
VANASEDPVLQALGFDAASLDVLLARTGLDTASLQARLMALELEGQVARMPGGRFQRVSSA